MIKTKRTEELSKAEIELKETFDLIHDLNRELNELKRLADAAVMQASVSHSLIVVRKIPEDKLDKFNQILD